MTRIIISLFVIENIMLLYKLFTIEKQEEFDMS